MAKKTTPSAFALIGLIALSVAYVSFVIWQSQYVDYIRNNRRIYIDGEVIVESLNFNDIVLNVKPYGGKPANQYRLVLQKTSGKTKPIVGLDYVLVQAYNGVVSMCKAGECIELSSDKNLSSLFVGLETTGEIDARIEKEEAAKRFK